MLNFKMLCIYHNELFVLIISLFTFVEKRKVKIILSTWKAFFSLISAVYVQIFRCSFLSFPFPINCWREWCITTAGDISQSSVSRCACLWNCLEIIVIPWLFLLPPPIDYNSGTAADRNWGAVCLVSKQFIMQNLKVLILQKVQVLQLWSSAL